MNRKNYLELEKFVARLKERISAASELEMQTESTKDLFDSILNFEILVYGILFDILKSERICSHCTIGESNEK